jgi:hypothetical protein
MSGARNSRLVASAVVAAQHAAPLLARLARARVFVFSTVREIQAEQ